MMLQVTFAYFTQKGGCKVIASLFPRIHDEFLIQGMKKKSIPCYMTPHFESYFYIIVL